MLSYVLLVLPFSINWGWITAATLANINITAVFRKSTRHQTHCTHTEAKQAQPSAASTMTSPTIPEVALLSCGCWWCR